jgi:hypothetical protein
LRRIKISPKQGRSLDREKETHDRGVEERKEEEKMENQLVPIRRFGLMLNQKNMVEKKKAKGFGALDYIQAENLAMQLEIYENVAAGQFANIAGDSILINKSESVVLLPIEKGEDKDKEEVIAEIKTRIGGVLDNDFPYQKYIGLLTGLVCR